MKQLTLQENKKKIMTFKPRNLFLKVLSKSHKFATIRVNWFSSNALTNPTDSTKVEEVNEDENQFAWKVEYLH